MNETSTQMGHLVVSFFSSFLLQVTRNTNYLSTLLFFIEIFISLICSATGSTLSLAEINFQHGNIFIVNDYLAAENHHFIRYSFISALLSNNYSAARHAIF